MKRYILLFTGLLVLCIITCGCTSQQATEPETPAPVTTTTAEVTHMETTTLIGTIWQLGWYDDTKGIWSKVIEGSTITATFSTDGKVTGFSGCSDYTTDYQVTDSPRIWFRRPAIPDKVCQTPTGVMSQQSAYYTDLEWTQTYSMKEGQLIFFDKTGKKILQFDKAP